MTPFFMFTAVSVMLTTLLLNPQRLQHTRELRPDARTSVGSLEDLTASGAALDGPLAATCLDLVKSQADERHLDVSAIGHMWQ